MTLAEANGQGKSLAPQKFNITCCCHDSYWEENIYIFGGMKLIKNNIAKHDAKTRHIVPKWDDKYGKGHEKPDI
jgi:hypothetical protein